MKNILDKINMFKDMRVFYDDDIVVIINFKIPKVLFLCRTKNIKLASIDEIKENVTFTFNDCMDVVEINCEEVAVCQ